MPELRELVGKLDDKQANTKQKSKPTKPATGNDLIELYFPGI